MFPINNLHEAVETAKKFLTKEKIDRQMTGQSSTPFMKLTDKKRKSVMYIKLEKKDVPYKPQIYHRGRGQNQRQFDRGTNWRGYRSFSRNYNEGNRGYGRGRSNLLRGMYGEVISEVDIIIE